MNESKVETYFCEQAEKNGAFVAKFTDPSRRGAPDRILFMPWGEVYFVELKRPKGGRLAALQKQYRKLLNKQNTAVYLLHTYDSVDQFFRRFAS